MLSISQLCDGSVYVLLGCPRRPGFFAVAVATAALQLWILGVFYSRTLEGAEHNDIHPGWEVTCVQNEAKELTPKCGDHVDENLTPGIFLGSLVLAAFQLKQVVAGVQILRQRAFLIGGVLIFMPIVSTMVTVVYVAATALTVTDILKDTVVLLFTMDVDELVYKALQFAANESVNKIETDIDNEAGPGTGPPNAPP